MDVDQPQAIKNHKATRFPLNARLKALLRGIRPKEKDRDTWVFRGPQGAPIDYSNFQSRHWKPTVERLAGKGEIAFYLPQYHCRHTWITMALASGMSIADVAYLARVSPGVIWSNYAGRSQKIKVPEL
jgi:integrase